MARVPEILVVDQDPQGRYEVKQLVRQAQLGFAGEAGFGTEAVSLASEVKPDAIFCAMSSPSERSLRTIEALLDVLPETPVIAYAQKEDVEAVRQTMLAGARDFLLIPATPARLLESVRSVLESEERKRLRLSGQSKGLGPKGLVVAVFGAKGGVGKTTIATNLGVALASNFGQSVAIIDADNSFGDVAAALELRPEVGIVDLVRDIDKVERANVSEYLARHSSGLSVLSAPRQGLLWREVTPDKLRTAIGLLARQFDIVLIDTAANLGDVSLAVLDEASMVLWVTSSDFSSINNSLLGLDALQQLQYPDSRIRLVLNITAFDDGVRPSKIEDVLKRTFFWTVPYDKQVRIGSQIGNPAVLSAPESSGSRAINALAEAVTGGVSKEVQVDNPKRLWPFGRRGERDETAPVADGG
ncbi:MAG TPA: AAA family ATPase [Dehalococcoidia bacterium]|nr:AAA family ATPase [Dehalococcoidia bacterium]